MKPLKRLSLVLFKIFLFFCWCAYGISHAIGLLPYYIFTGKELNMDWEWLNRWTRYSKQYSRIIEQ